MSKQKRIYIGIWIIIYTIAIMFMDEIPTGLNGGLIGLSMMQIVGPLFSDKWMGLK